MAQIAAPCPIHRTTYSQKKNRLVEYQNLLLSLCGNTNNSAALFTNNRTWINTNNATWINTDSAVLEEASICRDITAFAKFIIVLLQ